VRYDQKIYLFNILDKNISEVLKITFSETVLSLETAYIRVRADELSH
jgi:hypothetical protein